MPKINLNKLLVITGLLALILVVIFWFWWGDKEISIINPDKMGAVEVVDDGTPKSPIAGLSCDNYDRRPVAIMLASDPETRPLSGIGQADIVFEMPVTPSGMTRIMAIYQCGEPQEVGSIRSAREDFIPLAAGFGAVLAHWGGEREALKKLNSHIIDNVDAMIYETKYFFRKKGIPQPHNGFITFDKLIQALKELNYPDKNNFSGYIHSNRRDNPKNILNLANEISIDHPHPFDVRWNYDQNTNTYRRYRSGQPETDKNDGQQVSAGVVVTIKTTSSFTNQDYLTVVTAGQGDAVVHQNGIKISGRWSKDPSKLDSKLYFYDNEGKEIEFTPGKIWVEVVVN